MTEKRLVDEILGLPKPAEPEKRKPKNIYRQQAPTLHRRDVPHIDFFVVARFVHALITVKAAVMVRAGQDDPVETRLPLVTDMGKQVLHLPVWRKVGSEWQQAGYQYFEREGMAVAVPMMHGVVRYLGIRESAIINALFSLSMISVEMVTGIEGKRFFRQQFRGRLINPRDGQPLSVPLDSIDVGTMSAFILDKQRVNEWIKKELQKREKQNG